MSLVLVPITFRQACAFVAAHHRHHRPPRGMKFVLGVAEHGELVGVAIAGRPVARSLDNGTTIEVTRTCTNGVRNTNSILYGAAWRTARALGYQRMITYTQEGESGASLRAAGLRPVAALNARAGWDTPSRRRTGHGADNVPRTRWKICRSGATGGTRAQSTSDVAACTATSTPCIPAVSAGTAGSRAMADEWGPRHAVIQDMAERASLDAMDPILRSA
jgi:hypothetical protein